MRRRRGRQECRELLQPRVHSRLPIGPGPLHFGPMPYHAAVPQQAPSLPSPANGRLASPGQPQFVLSGIASIAHKKGEGQGLRLMDAAAQRRADPRSPARAHPASPAESRLPAPARLDAYTAKRQPPPAPLRASLAPRLLPINFWQFFLLEENSILVYTLSNA